MQEYYKFINEPLPYSYKAMEPFIDIQTMYLHHDKHLQTYVNNLNNLIAGTPEQGTAELSVFTDLYVRTAIVQLREYADGDPYTDQK